MSIYNSPGWKVKPADFKAYTLVTSVNRKAVVIMGRILYVIEANGTLVQYRGYFVIRPQLKKGLFKVSNHPYLKDYDTFIPEEEDRNKYIKDFDSLITMFINKKQLYFKITDKIVKYDQNKN